MLSDLKLEASQNLSYQQNLSSRLTTAQTATLRPTMRLVAPRHVYDNNRRSDSTKTTQLKDSTQLHHLRLTSNQSSMPSTTLQNSNPILSASNINLYASNAGLVRSGMLNLTPTIQRSGNGRQIFVQNSRQNTPQLQAAQGLRQNNSTKILAGNSSIRTGSISVQAQAARNCVSSMASSQVNTNQRHHNRQVFNAQKLIVTSTPSSISNPYNPIIIPSQVQELLPLPPLQLQI
ncbi:hypothetical protein MXB_1254 [Myxobolus squamalis]|nr:hypothetical protein MXB_1254 [Myxobolus squamalis]